MSPRSPYFGDVANAGLPLPVQASVPLHRCLGLSLPACTVTSSHPTCPVGFHPMPRRLLSVPQSSLSWASYGPVCPGVATPCPSSTPDFCQCFSGLGPWSAPGGAGEQFKEGSQPASLPSLPSLPLSPPPCHLPGTSLLSGGRPAQAPVPLAHTIPLPLSHWS